MRWALNIQCNLQRLPANIWGMDGDASASGVLCHAQLQVRVIELVAGLRQVGQVATASEQAVLAVGNGLAGLQVKKVGGGIAQVVEVGLGEREHPLRGGDTPVVPALAPTKVARDGAIDHGSG